MSDPGLTSEQRAAIAVHNATQNRMCLNLSSNGQICVACSEVADQIDAAVEVERQRSQEALAAARRECELRGNAFRSLTYAWRSRAMANEDGGDKEAAALLYGCAAEVDAAVAAPAAGEEGKR